MGAIALAIALICLFSGYFWGRSNVRSQVEDALDKARVSADAREFALRQALDEKMVELAEFSARAEELRGFGERPARLQSKTMHGPGTGNDPAEALENRTPANQVAENQPVTTPVVDSTEKTIQDLLKSIEQRINEPAKEPKAVAQRIMPAMTKPVEAPRAITQAKSKPAPAASPDLKPLPPAKDEWQEFAASLAALKSRQK